MKFYMHKDTPEARSLAKKMADFSKPGAIIMLTDEEWKAYEEQMVEVEVPGPTLTEVKPGSSYIMFVDLDKVCQQALEMAAKSLDINIEIVGIKE